MSRENLPARDLVLVSCRGAPQCAVPLLTPLRVVAGRIAAAMACCLAARWASSYTAYWLRVAGGSPQDALCFLPKQRHPAIAQGRQQRERGQGRHDQPDI